MYEIKTVVPACSNCGATVETLFSTCPVCRCKLEVELKILGRKVYRDKCEKCGFEHEPSEICREAESYFPGDGLTPYKDGVYIKIKV